MVILSNKHGFSLVEVLVATIVMSMIMVGVLGFVEYGGNVWHKGLDKITVQNYNDMAFQLLKDDLLQATAIVSPKKVFRDKSKVYKSITYDIGDDARYKVRIASGTLIREKINKTTKKPDTNERPIRLARNAKAFFVYRISTWTFDISLQIQAEKDINSEYEDTDSVDYDNNEDLSELGNITRFSEIEILSSETMTLLAPGI